MKFSLRPIKMVKMDIPTWIFMIRLELPSVVGFLVIFSTISRDTKYKAKHDNLLNNEVTFRHHHHDSFACFLLFSLISSKPREENKWGKFYTNSFS